VAASRAGGLASGCELVEGEQGFENGLEEVEVEGVGAVGFCFGGVVVDFKEDAVNAGGDGGAGEQGDELGLAAGDAARGGGHLYGVGAVEDDGGELAQDAEGAHVDDEVAVAEGGAALGERDALVAGGEDFADGVFHVAGGDELAFFDVDGAAGVAGGDEQVGLAAEEGRDLEDVGAFGGDFAVGGFVDVGEDGEAGGFGDGAEDAGAFAQAGAAEARDGGAVGLVVGGLEDIGDSQVGGNALDGLGHAAGVGFALDDAGAGDEEEAACADGDGADFVVLDHVVIGTYRDCG
jgi:hypothetical protein